MQCVMSIGILIRFHFPSVNLSSHIDVTLSKILDQHGSIGSVYTEQELGRVFGLIRA